MKQKKKSRPLLSTKYFTRTLVLCILLPKRHESYLDIIARLLQYLELYYVGAKQNRLKYLHVVSQKISADLYWPRRGISV